MPAFIPERSIYTFLKSRTAHTWYYQTAPEDVTQPYGVLQVLWNNPQRKTQADSHLSSGSLRIQLNAYGNYDITNEMVEEATSILLNTHHMTDMVIGHRHLNNRTTLLDDSKYKNYWTIADVSLEYTGHD